MLHHERLTNNGCDRICHIADHILRFHLRPVLYPSPTSRVSKPHAPSVVEPVLKAKNSRTPPPSLHRPDQLAQLEVAMESLRLQEHSSRARPEWQGINFGVLSLRRPHAGTLYRRDSKFAAAKPV